MDSNRENLLLDTKNAIQTKIITIANITVRRIPVKKLDFLNILVY